MTEIKKHLKIAYQAYRRNFLPIIISMVIILAVFLLFLFPAAFLMAVQNKTTITFAEAQHSGIDPSLDFQALFSASYLDLASSVAVFILLGLIATIFLSTGLAGICYYGLKKKVHINLFFQTLRLRGLHYFSATSIILSVFLLFYLPFQITVFFYGIEGVVANIILFSGSLLLLFLAPFFVLYSPSVISGKSVTQSIKESIYFGRKNYKTLLALIMIFSVLSLIEIIPVMGLIIEYLFLLPLLQIVFCSIYISEAKPKLSGNVSKRRKRRK